MKLVRCLALAVLLSAGCEPKGPYPVPVKGTVTLDGKPLAEGVISFVDLGDVPELIDVKDGVFNGRAKWGQRRIEIAAYRPYQIPKEVPESMHALMQGGKENYLPERYHLKSELTAEVTKNGPNEFSFAVTSK